MDIIFEIFLELVLDGAFELCKSKKVAKAIRYPLIFLFALLYIGVVAIIFITGVLAYQRIHKALGVLCFMIGIVVLAASAVQLRKAYQNRQKDSNDAELK